VKPNKVSFLLWSIAPFIALAAQLKQGVGLESLMTFSVGFFPLLIFLASFVNKDAKWELSKFDLWCGFLSIVGLILWMITRIGNVAIFFSILADGLAGLPTIMKAYKYPETEIGWPWMMTVFGSILALFTISQLSFANSAFIFYVIIYNTIVFSCAQFKIGKKLKFS
jgi:hypothetical protein